MSSERMQQLQLQRHQLIDGSDMPEGCKSCGRVVRSLFIFNTARFLVDGFISEEEARDRVASYAADLGKNCTTGLIEHPVEDGVIRDPGLPQCGYSESVS